MRRRLFILVLALLLLAGAGYGYVVSGSLHGRGREILRAAARRQFGREVTIGSLRGNPLRGIVLENVAIARRDRLADGALLTVDRVIVRFHPMALLGDLLRGRGVWPSIHEITLVRPDLALEISPAGRWNVFELFQPRGPTRGAPAPTPLVVIQEGRGTLVDASGPPWPFRARFSRVDGQADLRPWPVIAIRVDLVSVRDGRQTPLSARGKYVVGSEILDVDVTGGGAPLDQWGPYIVRVPQLAFEGGTADLAVHLLNMRWGGRRVLDYRGTVTLAQGAATLLPQGVRLRGINGVLDVDNLRLRSDGLRLSVDGSPLRVRGDYGLVARRLDLVATSPRLDLATVKRLFFPGWKVHLEGTTGADIRITGAWSALTIDGTIVDARGVINRQPLAVASSGLALVGDLLIFDDFTATAEGARVRGDLRLSLGRGDVLLAAEGEDVTPEMLRRGGFAFTLPVRGRVTGSIVLGRSSGQLVAETAAVMGAGTAGRFRVDHLGAGGWYENGEIAFPYLVAARGPMTVHASGTVSRRGLLAVDAAATALDLREVAREVGLTPRVRGAVDAEGRISGTLAEPVFEGTVVSGPGRVETITFDSAEGSLRVGRRSLTTSGIRLRSGPGTYLVSGAVRWTEPSSLALTVDARDIPAVSLARSTGLPVDVTGSISGRLSVGGTPSRLRVAGQVSLTAGGIEGQRLDEAAASFRWQNGTLHLDQARAQVRDSVVTARGTVDRRGALHLTFAARGFDLRHLTVLPRQIVQAGGRVDLDGLIGGRSADPTVAATFASRDLVVNGQAFDRAGGAVRWEDGRLFLEPVALSQGEGTYTIRGSLGLRNGVTFDLRGEVARGRLATFLAVGRLRPPVALDGRLDGTVVVLGTADRPAATLDARLSDGRFGDHPLEEAEVKLGYRGGVITVDRLTARAGKGVIAAQGRVALRGESQLEVGGADLNLDLLRPLLGVGQPLRGTLNFTTQISGPWQDPEIGLSLDIREGGIGALRFDSLVANAFYKEGQLHVEQALLSEDGHRVKGVGTIPFNPARRLLAEQRPMRFEISLGEADLSLLALLVPQVQEATGRLEGQVLLSGTPLHPEMSGRLAVRGGRIRLRGLVTPIEDVRADLEFTQDRLSLRTLTARLGSGTFSATGSVAIANFRPTAIERLTLRARDARLEVRPYFAGAVDADLTFGGPLRDPAHPPEATGQVVLKQGDFDALPLLRLVPAAANGRPAQGPDLRLRDVRLTTGPGLALHLGRLRADLNEGDTLTAGGTLRRPALSGRLTSEHGTVTIFGRTFSLRGMEARFLQEILGFKPLISFDAETEVPMETGPPTKVFLEARQVFPEELVDRVVLRSDPPLSRAEIVARLAGRSVATGPGSDLSTVDVQAIMRAELSRALFGGVEETIARALGLSEFTIQYDFARPLQLRIGRLIVRNLYVRLTTIFEQPTRFVASLGWRFYRNFMLTLSTDNMARMDALLQYTIQF